MAIHNYMWSGSLNRSKDARTEGNFIDHNEAMARFGIKLEEREAWHAAIRGLDSM